MFETPKPIQCLLFLENEDVAPVVAESRPATLKYVLFPSELKDDHPLVGILQQAGFQVISNQINIPESVRFEFCVLLVDEHLLSNLVEEFGKSVDVCSFVDRLLVSASNNWVINSFHALTPRSEHDLSTPRRLLVPDSQNLLLLKKFLPQGADMPSSKGTLLLFAANMGNTALVKLLLDHGANVNARGTSNPGADFSSALHIAVANRYSDEYTSLAVSDRFVDMAKLLIENGADLNTKNHAGSTPLHVALMRNTSLDIIKLLLESGADLGARNFSGATPLHLAVGVGCLEIVKYLLDHGANINARNNINLQYRGATPLHCSVLSGHEGIVGLLLERGVNVNAECHNGRTALYCAVEKKQPKILESLAAHTPDINNLSNKAALQLALAGAEEEHLEMALCLLSCGFDIGVEAASNSQLFFCAISQNLHSIVEKLLQLGADVNQLTGTFGVKPLHHAARYADGDMVQLLLNYGADLNDAVKSRTPLFEAINWSNAKTATKLLVKKANFRIPPGLLRLAVRKCPEAVPLLLEYGANAMEESAGRTLLHDAAIYSDGDMIKLLLSYGVCMNARVKGKSPGPTALFEAIAHSNAKTAKALLANNAGCRGPQAQSLLHLAVRKCPEIVQVLLECECGANVNQRNSEGRTPLHEAAVHSDGDVIQVLLDHGADINARVRNSSCVQTALSEAIVRSNAKTAKVLLANNATFLNSQFLLHTAVRTCPEIVWLLVERRIDVNARNSKGQTPLYVAVSEGKSLQVIDILIKCGAHLNCGVSEACAKQRYDFYKAYLAYCFADLDPTIEPAYVQRTRINSFIDLVLKIGMAYGHSETPHNRFSEIFSKIDDDLCHFPGDHVYVFKKYCEKEIADMKLDVVANTPVSVYDLLTKKNTYQISCLARNEEFLQAIDALNIEEKYPIYARILTCQLRKGIWRRQILNAGLKMLSSLLKRSPFAGLPNLPDDIKERIVSYWSNQDVLVLNFVMPNRSDDLLTIS